MKTKSSESPEMMFFNDIDLLSRLTVGVGLKDLHNARVSMQKLKSIDHRDILEKH